jgi:hypothetical protein
MAEFTQRCCDNCGQTFISDDDSYLCHRGCRLKPTWTCAECDGWFTDEYTPHTQHDPQCPVLCDPDLDVSMCPGACSWEDVCDDCCNICNPGRHHDDEELFPETEEV